MKASPSRFLRVSLALLLPVSGSAAVVAPDWGGRSFRFEPQPFAIAAPPSTPLSLTSSDGTGLKLTRLVSRAVVEGPLAFTELRLSFENPQDRVIE